MLPNPCTTKERILIESMKLFSVHGFDAVSIRTIADAVGVGNSALYKHYKSKQDIFDAIVARCHSMFLEKTKVIYQAMNQDSGCQTLSQVKGICLGMYTFQTTDEWIVMFRQILMMEQFKNPEMATLYKEFFIEMPVNSQAKIFSVLAEKHVIKDRDPYVLAMELYAPFYLHHLDAADQKTDPDNYALMQKRFESHLEYFFKDTILEQSLS